jgi:hypothetical protein
VAVRTLAWLAASRPDVRLDPLPDGLYLLTVRGGSRAAAASLLRDYLRPFLPAVVRLTDADAENREAGRNG